MTFKNTLAKISVIMLIVVGISGLLTMLSMPGRSYQGPLPELTASQKKLSEDLKRHVTVLSKDIGERNLWQYGNLKKSANYIKKSFEALGYTVKTQTYEIDGKPSENIEVEIKGNKNPDDIILVGAHYDSVQGSPGANDNASGVAALLEIARLFKNSKTFPKTIRFVAFVNEEPPIFLSSKMGSWQYAKRTKKRKEKIKAMISIETIGYYSDEKNSQSYPFPYNFFFPNTGNYIGFVSNLMSWKLVRQAISSFRTHTEFPSEGVAAPSWIPGVGWSDQLSFWRRGYRGIMVTDTALYRYPYYHAPGDTPEKLDYTRMARVVEGLSQVIADLAQ